MIILKSITENDVEKLNNTSYANLPTEVKMQMISSSQNENKDGKFFKLFIIEDGVQAIGVINFYAHSKSVVSIAPEIKEEFRGKGYGKCAINLSIEYAREKNYKVAYAGIDKDNVASMALHESLGFEFVQNFLSSRGKNLKMYMKVL